MATSVAARPAKKFQLREILEFGTLLFICILIAFSVVMLPQYLVMEGHAVRPSLLDKLSHGMSTEEVKTILGEPTEMLRDDDGSQEWVYSSYTWCYVTVVFSEDGRFVEYIHDH